MLTQALPQAAEAYAAEQRAEIGAAVSAIRRQWRRMDRDFDASWSRLGPRVLAVAFDAQERVASGALGYIPDVLDETGQRADAVARPRVRSLVGVAGDGRPVVSLLEGAVVRAKIAVSEGASVAEALSRGGRWLSMTTGTVLSDTGRQAESLGMGVRSVSGYVRMLNPPSCSRCVVLAGRWYRKSAGFARHPGCDCRHIPTSESLGGDLTVDPQAYFDSLSADEQRATFGQAGADAIREGADIAQVVNARRGVRVAQDGTRFTSEGTTSRGRAFQALRDRGAAQELAGTAVRVTRNGPEMRVITRTRATERRPMPETIARVATDRADYLRLLQANGYL